MTERNVSKLPKIKKDRNIFSAYSIFCIISVIHGNVWLFKILSLDPVFRWPLLVLINLLVLPILLDPTWLKLIAFGPSEIGKAIGDALDESAERGEKFSETNPLWIILAFLQFSYWFF